MTDEVETFVESGIKLRSGARLGADLVITATGLNLQVLGGAELDVDGRRTDPATLLSYKGVLLSDIPNLASVFGYTNASWTLKADLSLAAACDAPGASLVPAHSPLDANCRGRIDADALYHAVHQLGLANDPVQHRSAVTEVAHGQLFLAPYSRAQSQEGLIVALRDPDHLHAQMPRPHRRHQNHSQPPSKSSNRAVGCALRQLTRNKRAILTRRMAQSLFTLIPPTSSTLNELAHVRSSNAKRYQCHSIIQRVRPTCIDLDQARLRQNAGSNSACLLAD